VVKDTLVHLGGLRMEAARLGFSTFSQPVEKIAAFLVDRLYLSSHCVDALREIRGAVLALTRVKRNVIEFGRGVLHHLLNRALVSKAIIIG